MNENLMCRTLKLRHKLTRTKKNVIYLYYSGFTYDKQICNEKLFFNEEEWGPELARKVLNIYQFKFVVIVALIGIGVLRILLIQYTLYFQL